MCRAKPSATATAWHLSFIYGRTDARRKHREDEKRTKMVNDYLKGVSDKPHHERPAAASVVVKALQKAGE